MIQTPVIKEAVKWMFKAYIVWSICADIILIGGVVLLLLGDVKIEGQLSDLVEADHPVLFLMGAK